MERIVQLSNRDYKDLVKKAELNEYAIEHKAKELYKEKGYLGINLSVKVTGGEDYGDTENIKVKTKVSIKDWKGKHSIPITYRRKLIDFIQGKSEEMFYRQFGESIYRLDELNNSRMELDKKRNQYTSITIIGWGMSISMFIAILIILFLK